MSSLDPRTPIIVGSGQLNDRDHGSEPIDLMTRCAEAALTDAASAALRDRIDAVRVVWGVWPYVDPGRLIADRLGAGSARTSITTMGGNQVYDLVTDTAVAAKAAWKYPEPTAGFEEISDGVAVMAAAVDRLLQERGTR